MNRIVNLNTINSRVPLTFDMYLGKSPQQAQAASTVTHLIKVTLSLYETERARLEWDLKNKQDELDMYKERLTTHTRQQKDLFTVQVGKVVV